MAYKDEAEHRKKQAEYQKTPFGRETARRFRQTEKGKATRKRSRDAFLQTDKGQAYRDRRNARKRERRALAKLGLDFDELQKLSPQARADAKYHAKTRGPVKKPKLPIHAASAHDAAMEALGDALRDVYAGLHPNQIIMGGPWKRSKHTKKRFKPFF